MKPNLVKFWGTAILLAGLALPAGATDEQVELGEYLAGECTGCHRIDGSDNGIPAIVGWEKESFVEVMKSYKDGTRENPAMVNVAKALSEDDIKALAAYFGQLKPKDDD